MNIYIWNVEKLDTMLSVVFKVSFDDRRLDRNFTAYVMYNDLHLDITNEEIIDIAWNQVKETVKKYKYWYTELSFKSLIGTTYLPKD